MLRIGAIEFVDFKVEDRLAQSAEVICLCGVARDFSILVPLASSRYFVGSLRIENLCQFGSDVHLPPIYSFRSLARFLMLRDIGTVTCFGIRMSKIYTVHNGSVLGTYGPMLVVVMDSLGCQDPQQIV